MWGLNRFQRPAWSTGTLIPISFLCQILSGVFIWRGGQKTKRTAVVEERLRTALGINTSQLGPGVLARRSPSNNHPTSAPFEPDSNHPPRETIVVDEHMTV